MTRPSGSGPRTLAGIVAVAALATLTLVGCSADKPTPKNSPGSSNGATSPAELKDQSAAVLAWTPPAPVAKTKGKLSPIPALTAATAPALAEIISVRASDTSTILVWQLSSTEDISVQGVTLNSIHGARFWPDAVRLVDPVGKTSYAVNTMDVGVNAHCVCSKYPLHVGPDPVRMTSEYPALLPTATSISVHIPNFAPVTVPVIRS